MIISLDEAERATILAALCLYQQKGMGDPEKRPIDIHQLATNNDQVMSSLDEAGVRALFIRIQQNTHIDVLSETSGFGWLHHVPVEGTKGQLSFAQIIDLIETRGISKFNYFDEEDDIQAELLSTWFGITTKSSPQFSFNEADAAEAIFDGDRLAMPDAQGFMCVIEFGDIA